MNFKAIENDYFQAKIFEADAGKFTVCLVGGVHGNENCGVQAIKEINYKFIKGLKQPKSHLITILANLRAIAENKRYVDWDLNRAFSKSQGVGYEKEIAESLTPYLKQVDYLVDFHSTSASTQPFCAGALTDQHLNLFEITKIGMYTHGWETLRGHSMLIDEVDRHKGVGIIVECGKHDEIQTNQTAHNVAERIIKALIYDDSKYSCQNHNKIIKIQKIIKATSNDFSFVRKFRNFEYIEKNTVIAYDNERPISFTEPFTIVMPTNKRLKIGEEAFAVGII